MKKWLITLAIREMQIGTTLRFHLTPVRLAIIDNKTNAGKSTREREHSYTIGRNVK
jgi:hypothetical protein